MTLQIEFTAWAKAHRRIGKGGVDLGTSESSILAGEQCVA